MVTSLPTRSLIPVMVGRSVSNTNASKLMTGSDTSTIPDVVTVARLPASSSTDTSTESSPCGKSLGTVMEYVPSPCTVVVNVVSLPALSVSTMVTVVPASLSPLMVGRSESRSVISTVIDGGVISISPTTVTLVVLPASSVISAVMVTAPSGKSLGTAIE